MADVHLWLNGQVPLRRSPPRQAVTRSQACRLPKHNTACCNVRVCVALLPFRARRMHSLRAKLQCACSKRARQAIAYADGGKHVACVQKRRLESISVFSLMTTQQGLVVRACTAVLPGERMCMPMRGSGSSPSSFSSASASSASHRCSFQTCSKGQPSTRLVG